MANRDDLPHRIVSRVARIGGGTQPQTRRPGSREETQGVGAEDAECPTGSSAGAIGGRC
jgi:hypothetical protein